MTVDTRPVLSPLSHRTVQVFGGTAAAQGTARHDVLAAEVPVALVFNGISHAVMMATPQDIEAFALGFALSEGILDAATDCRGIEVNTVDAATAGLPPGVDAIEVQLEISTRSFERLKGRRRSLAGRTGCGVCGVESFAGLELESEPLPPHDWVSRVDLQTVLRAIDALPAWQRLNAEAGAIHAAGWATLEGELVAVLEDVGRHNALDKVIGDRLLAGGLPAPDAIAVLSGRVSFELVQKTVAAGVPVLCAVSAPSSLAVETAGRLGLTLAGFVRDGRLTVYTHPERISGG